MKHVTRILLSLITFVISSCDNTEPKMADLQEVSFSFGYEMISQSFAPMTRSDNEVKYYAMNVYQDGRPYAYGVFDDVSKMSVMLSAASTYKFEVTTVSNDRHQIAKINDEDGGHFTFPFCLGDDVGFPLNDLNHFIYSKTVNLSKIKNAKSTVCVGETDADGFAFRYKDEAYPSQLRYYGERDDYTLDSQTSVNIELKSMSTAIRFEAESVPDGSVTWSCPNKEVDFCKPKIDADNLEQTTIFAMDYILFPTRPISLYIVVEWNRPSGLKTKDVIVECKRNTMQVVTLNLVE